MKKIHTKELNDLVGIFIKYCGTDSLNYFLDQISAIEVMFKEGGSDYLGYAILGILRVDHKLIISPEFIDSIKNYFRSVGFDITTTTRVNMFNEWSLLIGNFRMR